MSDSMHLGSERYSKAAAILEGASVQSNAVVGRNSVNSELFSKIELAESHARRIMQTGSSQYIPGIKENVLELIRMWLQIPDEPVFTLYGKMGCGKSFFSAHLYEQMRQDTDRYHTVAFSSQQTYRDTTQVRTMLISIANQLFQNVGACGDYFAKVALDSESISNLTEQVLVDALETASLSKTLLVIIDGLDEYPRGDCEEFLETLGRLRDRLNPQLKIYFSSRPEEYIRSEMFHDPVTGAYSIENNAQESQQDCLRFIRAKCRSAGVQMSEKLQQELVEKCGFSLKYLDCFFNDISCGGITVTEDFIENLPKGLSNYYKDQLIRYFGDRNLEFYQSRIVPLLEVLCVVWRPVTVDEVCDILGWQPRDVQNVISRSGTLLWKNDRYVMLYQSESIKEFLLDERYCPDKYRIECANGKQRILRRLQDMMENEEDIDENLYLLEHAADHLLDKEKPTNADWQQVLNLVNAYAHKTDLMRKLTAQIYNKPGSALLKLITLLFADGELEPILREYFCVRLIAGATEQNCAKADKLLETFEMLEGADDYHFMICYGRSRIYRTMGKMSLAAPVFQENPVEPGIDLVGMYRHNLYLDEICRIYRRTPQADWRVVTQLHIAAVREFADIYKKIGDPQSPAYQISMSGLGVSYDQLGRLCETLEQQKDTQLRIDCAEQICQLLMLPANGEQPGCFLTLAAACYEKSLKQTKLCQRFDSRSVAKVYQMHYSFYALGRLYSTKAFPGYSLERAVTYFDDCLDSIMPIIEKPGCQERFLDVPIKIYERLVTAFREAEKYQAARDALAQKALHQDTKVLRNPSMTTEFNRCFCYEEEAQIVRDAQGIAAAEPYYLEAVRQYRRCAEKYPDEAVQRACYVVYANMSNAYSKTEDREKEIEYLELTVAEARRVQSQFPREALKWNLAVNLAYLSLQLQQKDPVGTKDRCIGLLLESLQLRKELAVEFPENVKYQSAPLLLYRTLFECYRKENDMPTLFFYFRECVETAMAAYDRCRTTISHLFAPLNLVMELRKELLEQGELDKWLAVLEPLIELVDPAQQDSAYQRLCFLILNLLAEQCMQTQGNEAATALQQKFYTVGRDYAFSANDMKILQFAAQDYSKFLLKRISEGAVEASVPWVQQVLADMSQYIQTHEETEALQYQCSRLYLQFADTVRKHASEQYLSSVIDLYIMASIQYAGLQKHTGKKEFLQNKIHALSKLTALADRLEQKLEALDTAKKRDYLQLLIKIYTFFAEQRVDNAAKKLALYTKMLEEL